MKKEKKSISNRLQKRLLEKQLKKFAITFNSFSIFQLEYIRDLIVDIIERKKENE